MKKTNPYLGYFEGSRSTPTVDPGKDIDCFMCMKPLMSKADTGRKLVAVSFVAANGGPRSYFYRVHKDCYNNLSENDLKMYEEGIVDNLETVDGNWLPPTLTNGLGEKVSEDFLLE